MEKDALEHLMQQLFHSIPSARLSDPRHEALRNELERVIGTLEPLEAILLRLRYGLLGGSALSIAELAFGMNLGVEKVQELETSALQKLRECCSTRKITRYLGKPTEQAQ